MLVFVLVDLAKFKNIWLKKELYFFFKERVPWVFGAYLSTDVYLGGVGIRYNVHQVIMSFLAVCFGRARL